MEDIKSLGHHDESSDEVINKKSSEIKNKEAESKSNNDLNTNINKSNFSIFDINVNLLFT